MTTSTFYGGPISIHALLTEGDSPKRRAPAALGDFNPRPPHGGRRQEDIGVMQVSNFNPRPPHGGRQENIVCITDALYISIHALLTEGDVLSWHCARERRLFQSTPSSRRATMVHFIPFNSNSHFNPRPPHGGRPTAFWACFCASRFQSTPSSRRATVCQASQHWHLGGFQSTPSSRRATVRMGGLPRQGIDFNPRPPHGGRRERFAL